MAIVVLVVLVVTKCVWVVSLSNSSREYAFTQNDKKKLNVNMWIQVVYIG